MVVSKQLIKFFCADCVMRNIIYNTIHSQYDELVFHLFLKNRVSLIKHLEKTDFLYLINFLFAR